MQRFWQHEPVHYDCEQCEHGNASEKPHESLHGKEIGHVFEDRQYEHCHDVLHHREADYEPSMQGVNLVFFRQDLDYYDR